MESYTEIDGVPLVANKNLLNYLLRYRLQFDGVLVTDYSEIYNLYDWHHTVGTKLDAVLSSITETSIDVSMIPWDAELYITSIKEGISSKTISEGRIRQSTERIIRLKYDLGMFNNTLTIVDSDLNSIGTPAERDEALNVAHDSVVLVKNNDNSVLPVKDKTLKIHVTGPTSNSIAYGHRTERLCWMQCRNHPISLLRIHVVSIF
jgi:beta-glucosidase